MYELLIPSVIKRFSAADQSERAFLEDVQAADVRLGKHFRTRGQPVSPAIYAEPLIRAAYLLRHLGHYSLQIGDVLMALDGEPAAAAVLARPHLKLAALCGGPAPEAVGLACLHRQFDGQQLEVTVLDLNARHWSDCWPISAAIALSYPQHPCVAINGHTIDLFSGPPDRAERTALDGSQVFTAMNCLNELVGLGLDRLSSALSQRLEALPSGALVLASDLAGYGDCTQGLNLLRQLLLERKAQIILDDQGQVHVVSNRLGVPSRIAWMYSEANQNRFRIHVKQLRLAAVLP